MQDIPLDIQGYYFLNTIVLGITVGLLFDLNRTCRYFWRPRRTMGVVLDVLFCLGVTVVVYGGLLLTNWGEVRFYVFVGMMLGLALYYASLSRFVLWVLRRLIQGGITLVKGVCSLVKKISATIFRLLRVLFWPVTFLGRLFQGWLGKIRGAAARAGGTVRQKAKKYVKFFARKKS